MRGGTRIQTAIGSVSEPTRLVVVLGCCIGWLPVLVFSIEVRAARLHDPAYTVMPVVAWALGAALFYWVWEQKNRPHPAYQYLWKAVVAEATVTAVTVFSWCGDTPWLPGWLLGCGGWGYLTLWMGAAVPLPEKTVFTDRQRIWSAVGVALTWIVLAWLGCQLPFAETVVLTSTVMLAGWLLAWAWRVRASDLTPSSQPLSNLMLQKLRSLENRQALAAWSLGFAFACMADLLSPAEIQKTMHWNWWVLLVALAIAMVVLMIDKAYRGEPNYWFGLRCSMLFAIVAFFPFDALSVLGIRAAFWGLECGFVLSTLFLVMVIAQTRALLAEAVPLDVTMAVGAYCAGIACGVLFSRMNLAGDETSVREGGLLALLLVACATNVLLKEESVRAIRMVHAGQIPLPVPQERVMEDYVDQACRELAARYALSGRELDVLYLLARGHSLARIQEELFISEGTASTHRRHVYKKLEVHNKQELIELVEMWRA